MRSIFVPIGKAVIAESFFRKIWVAYRLNNEVMRLTAMNNAKRP